MEPQLGPFPGDRVEWLGRAPESIKVAPRGPVSPGVRNGRRTAPLKPQTTNPPSVGVAAPAGRAAGAPWSWGAARHLPHCGEQAHRLFNAEAPGHVMLIRKALRTRDLALRSVQHSAVLTALLGPRGQALPGLSRGALGVPCAARREMGCFSSDPASLAACRIKGTCAQPGLRELLEPSTKPSAGLPGRHSNKGKFSWGVALCPLRAISERHMAIRGLQWHLARHLSLANRARPVQFPRSGIRRGCPSPTSGAPTLC